MPINSLTRDLTDRMPRAGQIRKGAKKTQANRPGEDLTYFRFVCNDPEIDRRFHEVYEDEPRVLNVHLAFPDLERNFPTWNEEHGKGGIKHRCDEEIMILWQDEEGLYHTDPKPCPYADLPKNDPGRKCKQKGLLRVIIDELGELAYVDVHTGGKWDCIGLTENVLAVEDMARRATAIMGRPFGVQGIPCQLKREPRMTSCPPRDGSHGNRVREEKWMLYLYVHPDFNKALMEAMTRYNLPVVDLPQLDAPTPDLEVDYYVGNGDDIEYPETEIVDEEPQASPNGEVPEEARTATNLLKYVNAQVQVPYDNINDLRSQLAGAGLEGDTWPPYSRKPEWWQEAFDLAFAIAEAKEYA